MVDVSGTCTYCSILLSAIACDHWRMDHIGNCLTYAVATLRGLLYHWQPLRRSLIHRPASSAFIHLAFVALNGCEHRVVTVLCAFWMIT